MTNESENMRMSVVHRLKAFARRFFPVRLQTFLKKLYYPRVLRRFREDQWSCAPAVKCLISEGDCVVDAGANIGYVTMLLSRWVGDAGHVYSFEPVPETFDVLQSNVRRLGLSNVTLHHSGLSSSNATVQMVIPCYENGGENLYESHITEAETAQSGRTVSVSVRRLDSVLGDASVRPSFLKIDVEGHELSVLEGAQAVIDRYLPAMLIEVAEGSAGEMASAQALFRRLHDRGYAAYWWSGEGLGACPGPCGKVDYLFVQPAHCERLKRFIQGVASPRNPR